MRWGEVRWGEVRWVEISLGKIRIDKDHPTSPSPLPPPVCIYAWQSWKSWQSWLNSLTEKRNNWNCRNYKYLDLLCSNISPHQLKKKLHLRHPGLHQLPSFNIITKFLFGKLKLPINTYLNQNHKKISQIFFFLILFR